MTTRISELLAAAAERTVPVVQGIDDKQLFDATPCTDFNVSDLVNHLFQVVTNFQVLATKGAPDFSSAPDFVRADWRERFAIETRTLIEAWSDPAAHEGNSPGMGFPQQVVGGMALLDLTVHGWDLAQGTGQPYRPDDAAVASLRPLAEQMAPKAREMGVFAAMTAFPPDADDFTRLLALTGRKPD
ncbi:TIGR03086 family metal-binding protein [Actinoplanes sp. NPDC026619]|uniref:TIGR03086 family metal-binding protein n=1 Tax=Actinoplanes sp. NPDC026619 TaxID=3155798 RepID=UPI00340FF961